MTQLIVRFIGRAPQFSDLRLLLKRRLLLKPGLLLLLLLEKE